ncbi:LPS export ABC transporter ATP-binding protein [Acidobacteriota bacterium]
MSRKLATTGLSKAYSKRVVVDDVSIDINPGEVVGLLGPNGAGKTTTFYMLVGLLTPDHGRIYLDGVDISSFPMYRRARMGLSYLPQETSVFRRLTVEENILAILETRDLEKHEREEELNQLLNDLGLSDLRKSMAYRLSGGERRRVEIARALVLKPAFMLLDEPFAGIDPKTVLEIQRIIAMLQERGIGILITDHNVRETLQITDRAYIINAGNIFRAGTPIELANDEEVQRIYLGEKFSLM